jgi:hypothetical protein
MTTATPTPTPVPTPTLVATPTPVATPLLSLTPGFVPTETDLIAAQEWARNVANHQAIEDIAKIKNPEYARQILIENGPGPSFDNRAVQYVRKEYPDDEVKQKWFRHYAVGVAIELEIIGRVIFKQHGEKGINAMYNVLKENPAKLEEIAKEAPPAFFIE